MANEGQVTIVTKYRDEASKGLSKTDKAVAGLKRQVMALAAAWGVKEVMTFTVEVAKLAATARLTEETFAKLAQRVGTTASNELAKMRKAVGGTMSDLDLMRKVGAAVDAGLTFDQSITALQFLRRYSLAFGKDFNQLVQTIFTGLQRGSVLFLDDAGIILSAQDSMFSGMGELEKKTALVGEAIRLMGEKMKILPEIQENAATEADRLAVAWENVRLAIGKLAEGPVAGVLSSLASAAQGAAEFLDAGTARPRREEELRIAVERAKAERTLFGWLVAGDIEISEQIDHMREEAKVIDDLADAARKRREEETAAIVAIIDKTKTRLAWEKEVADTAERQAAALRVQAGEDRLAGEMSANQEAQDAKARATIIADAETDAFLDAEGKRLDNRLSMLDAIENLEARASGDRLKIMQQALKQEYQMDLARARSMGATEEQVQKIRKAYQELNKDLVRDNDPVVKRILLIFDADASQVQTQSDLAAYSLGLLVNQLRNISPAISDTISGIQQVVVGAKAGGAAGAAGIVSGGIQVLGAVIGHFSRKAEEARRKVEELKRQIQAAGDAAGEYAKSIEQNSLMDLQRQFMANIRALRAELNTSGGGVIKFSQDLYTYTGQTGKATLATVALESELRRLQEAIGRFGGEAATYAQALTKYQHELRMTGVDDPEKKLAILKDVLGQVGLFISSAGELSGRLDQLNLAERWAIEETIVQIFRDIAEVEIDARQQQADLVIDSIYEQADAVEEALMDAAEAQKRSALRAVRLKFDVEEMAVRRSFAGALTGAGGDPFEQARVVQELMAEIALLQLAEEAEANAVLANIRAAIDSAKEANDNATDLLVQAVDAAAANSDLAFEAALAVEIGGLGDNFGAFLSAASGDISGATLATRAAILDQTAGIDVIGTNTANMATSIPNVVVAIGDLNTDLVDGLARIVSVGPTPVTNPNFDVMRSDLSLVQRNTLGIWNEAWYTRRELRDHFNAMGSGGGGSGPAGVGTLNFAVNVNIDTIDVDGGGDADGGVFDQENWANNIWAGGLQAVVVDSLWTGYLGSEVGRLLRAMGIDTTGGSTPSNIRT